jgi:ribonucleoside-diphosphate reductase alpha chain
VVRRGAFAAYLDIDHGDIEEFLQIKDIGFPIQNLFTGVCIPDYWMQEMIDGDNEKRRLWAKVLESRQKKGLPYLFFTDNVNRSKPKVYKDKGYSINSSNLCSEIMLPSTDDESFICCLSSLNLELYDEWKDTNTVKNLVYLLDSLLTEFIDKSKGRYGLDQVRKFAERHRAIGIGKLTCRV